MRLVVRTILVALLVLPVVHPCRPLVAAPPPSSPVAALGALVPAHHALHAFEGPVTWYEHRPPPQVGYVQPDFEAWATS